VEVKGAKVPYRDSVVRVVALRDVTARKQAEETERRWLAEQAARREAEAAERRADFLAEASRVLASSFDYSTTLTPHGGTPGSGGPSELSWPPGPAAS
jgi:hypothetical protein